MAVYSGIVVLSLGAPPSLIFYMVPHVLLQAYKEVRDFAVAFGMCIALYVTHHYRHRRHCTVLMGVGCCACLCSLIVLRILDRSMLNRMQAHGSA